MKALIPAMNPMWKSSETNRIPWMTPATPASAPPRAKATTITLSVSMPISLAISRSCEVARIALPRRVPFTKVSRATISATAAVTANTDVQAMVTPPTENVRSEMMRGKDRTFFPPG